MLWREWEKVYGIIFLYKIFDQAISPSRGVTAQFIGFTRNFVRKWGIGDYHRPMKFSRVINGQERAQVNL